MSAAKNAPYNRYGFYFQIPHESAKPVIILHYNHSGRNAKFEILPATKTLQACWHCRLLPHINFPEKLLTYLVFLMPLTDLIFIANAAEKNKAANEKLKSILLGLENAYVDELVFSLNNEISPQIDCTQCGNCCRSLMINVEKEDALRLAAYLALPVASFENKYIERSSEGELCVMNAIPCSFLQNNKCMVYEARPNECREFPGLHRPNFKGRLFATFMHYGRCPIIYNVIEALKKKLFAVE